MARWRGRWRLSQYLTILLSALLVFGAEIVRHGWLHDILPMPAANLAKGFKMRHELGQRER